MKSEKKLFKVLKQPVFQIGLIFFLTLIIYSSSFIIPFIWDDEVQILGNKFVTEGGFLKDIFTTSVMMGGNGPGGNSFYRPLVILLYRFEYIFFGSDPTGFHIISLVFHFINIAFVYFLARKIACRHFPILPSGLCAFLASFLFAFHPANAEAISWLASQGDLMATSFALGALLFLFLWTEDNFGNWKFLAGAQILFFLTLFTKESFFVFPLTFLVYLFYFFRKSISSIYKFIEVFFIPAIIYVFFRFLIAKIYFGSTLSLMAKASLLERFLTAITSLADYLKIIIFPVPLFTDRQFVIKGLTDYRFIISVSVLILLAVVFLWLHKKASPAISFLGFWFLIGIFPVLNVVFITGQAMAERYLYFPAIGIFILSALGLVFLIKETPSFLRAVVALFLLIIFCFFGRTVMARNELWQKPLDFYQHDANLSPESFLLQNNLGVELFRQGRYEEAGKAFAKAIEIEPKYGVSHNNLGAIFQRRGEAEEAILEYKKAIELSGYYLAYINLSDIYIGEERYGEAISLLEQAAKIFPYDSAIFSRLEFFRQKQK